MNNIEDVKKLKNKDIFYAMLVYIAIWYKVTIKKISNCFNHYQFQISNINIILPKTTIEPWIEVIQEFWSQIQRFYYTNSIDI